LVYLSVIKHTLNFSNSHTVGWLVGWLELNVPFQHKYGYIMGRHQSTERHL